MSGSSGAVLSGEKTATSSLLCHWPSDEDEPPLEGELQALVDSASKPVAIIEITAADIIRLGGVRLALAREEGEART